MVAKAGGKNIANAVKETLDSVVSPSVRDAILARALAAGRLRQMPNEAHELGDFVQGPLHDSLVQSLGSELGVSVTTEIERLVALAAPHTARPSKVEASTHAPEPPRKPSTRNGCRSPGRSDAAAAVFDSRNSGTSSLIHSAASAISSRVDSLTVDSSAGDSRPWEEQDPTE